MSHHHSSPFPSCFRPSSAADFPLPPPSPAPTSGNPNLTTCLYQTEIGIFALTWSRTFLGHSLSLNLHPIDSTSTAAGNTYSPVSLSNHLSLSTISFNLHIKPFLFWKKHGSKKLQILQETAMKPPKVEVFWDLSRAKFGFGPEPQSGFYLSVVVDREMVLLVGDLTKEACAKTKGKKPERTQQVLLLRREHVFGNRVYTTKARFGGKNREITIDCSVNSDAKLCFSVDKKKVLQIKRLRWKFRGNERIEVDGVNIQVSWDVYNWLFEEINNEHAVFMFKFEDENQETNRNDDDVDVVRDQENKNGVVLWQEQQENTSGGGIVEWRKMRKSFMRTARSSSSSSISMSSASSGCSSSVMEWASVEESELSSPIGFSLLVYAWKK